MNRRDFTRTASGSVLGILLCGCTSSSSAQSGTVIGRIEVLNVRENATELTVVLRNADGNTVYEGSIPVDGTPGNQYVRNEIADLPRTPVTEAEARVDADSVRTSVPESDEAVEMTVICNPDGEVGIAWFGRQTETQN
mgnify:CR=1 FL=1